MPPAPGSGAAHAQGTTMDDAWACVGRLAAEIAGTADRRRIADALLSHGLRAVRASGGLVAVTDVDAGESLHVLAARGHDGPSRHAVGAVPLVADVPLAEAGRTGRRVIVGDMVGSTGRWPEGPLVPESGALACIPFAVGEGGTGVMEVRWDTPVRLDPSMHTILDAIAALAAQALGRTSLADSVHRARAEAMQADVRSAALAAVAEAFSAARDEEAVLDALVGSGLPPAGATSAAVLRLDETGALVAVRLVGYPDDARAPMQTLPVADAIRRASPSSSRTPNRSPDSIPTWPASPRESAPAPSLRSRWWRTGGRSAAFASGSRTSAPSRLRRSGTWRRWPTPPRRRTSGHACTPPNTAGGPSSKP